MALKAHPVYPYRNFQIDRIPIPPPTAAELITAIVILSRTFESLCLKYGLISSSAIYLHGTSFALPCLLPSQITVLIQPSPKLSAMELTQLLCDRRYKNEFFVTRKDGIDVPKIIVKRAVGDRSGDVFVQFKILDHWLCYEKRPAYDFRRAGNETVLVNIGSDSIPILNPQWLLLQKISEWSSRMTDQDRRNDEIEVRTLVDVLGFRKCSKARVRGRAETDELRTLVTGMDRDDPGVLGSVVDCPDVFGPWWKGSWMLVIWAVVGAVILVVGSGSLDYGEVKVRQQLPYHYTYGNY
ncbi:hypothetical protein LZ554_003308 [Drepanopeziza brunnea f. sp. 'monogermtubi']|nr:hypothetical protein LZ554_003308 [Drepanopeziza brunnea f. sp. 'monogermtubi']